MELSKHHLLISLIVCCLPQINLFAQAAIELEKMNVVIAGLDNPLTIVASDVPDSCISVQASAGEIIKGSETHYTWRGLPDTTALTLVLFDTCQHEWLGERTFRVKEIPAAIYLSERYKGGAITKGYFKAQSGLSAFSARYDVEARFPVVGFTVEIYNKKTEKVWRGYNAGGIFTGEVSTKIQAVEVGDCVIFRQISWQYPGKKQPKYSSAELIFTIE